MAHSWDTTYDQLLDFLQKRGPAIVTGTCHMLPTLTCPLFEIAKALGKQQLWRTTSGCSAHFYNPAPLTGRVIFQWISAARLKQTFPFLRRDQFPSRPTLNHCIVDGDRVCLAAMAVLPLWLVTNLAKRWRHLYQLVTIGHLYVWLQIFSTRWRHLHIVRKLTNMYYQMQNHHNTTT